MNRAYRLVWNNVQNAFVPAPENARRQGKSASRVAVSLLGLALAGAAHALPTDGQVTAGSGSIATTGATMTVNQGSQNLSLNWASFNIAANEAVRFNQPNSSAIALNRVLGTDGSQILGSLSANGQVFILNPNGVLFGPNAQVNVGGLVASTLKLSDADFLSGKYRFTGAGGSVLNQGTIDASSYVALLGGQVGNEGVIVAKLGKVALAAGNAVTLDLAGDKLLNLQVDEGALNALAENKGLIKADGGEVLLTARSADALIQTVVNNEGVIEARTVENQNGVIKLLGDMTHGTVKVGGTLDASNPDGKGGFIETSAAQVDIDPATQVKAGHWLIDPTDITVSDATAYNTALGNGTDVTIDTASANGDAGNLTLAANIAKTAGTDATLTLKADNDIVVNGVSISSTSNKLNVVLNSDSDSSGLGYIYFSSVGGLSSIASNGGNIVMGGGSCDTAGCTGAAGGATIGIGFSGVSLTSGGGDITLVGSSTGDSGIRAVESTINSGGGSLLLRGTTTSTGADHGGIYLGNATVESGAGSLTLEGRGATWYGGIHLESATIGNASQTGDITLAAQSNAGVDSIEVLHCGMGCNAPKIQGAGTLTLKPLDNYTTIGLGGGAGDFNLSATELGYIQSGFTDITVGGWKSGAITVEGAWTVPTSANLKLRNYNNLGITTHGIALNGALTLGTGKFLALVSDGAVTQTAAISAPSLIVSGLGNFTLDNAGNNVTTLAAAIQNNAQDNSLSFTNGGALTVGTVDGESGVSAGDNVTLTADGINIASGIWGAGTLTLQPRTAATTIGLGTGAAGTLSLGYTALNRIDTGFSQVVIGRADGTGRIEVGDMGGTPFKSDLTLRAPGAGGDIYVGPPSMGYALETGSGADAGSITLIAGRNITNDGSIYTRGGHVILNANAAGAGGNILMDTNTSIATNGGNLVMGGGTCTTTDCTGAATGYDVSYHDGIYLNGASLDAGAGAIVLRGAGSTAGGATDTTGIFIVDGSSLNAIGITLTGAGGNGANYGYGVYAGNAALNANSGTLTVTGTGGTGSGATNDGISFAGTTNLSSDATGNALILSGTSFVNAAGAGALSAANGRWLVYSASPAATTKGGLTSGFRHYNASYAGYAPASVTESGNGFIYASAAGNLAVNTTLASGAASHTYGGTPTATYGYTLSGTFADSEDNAGNIGVAGTAAYANAPTAASPAGSYTVTYANGLTSTVGYGFTAGTGLAYTVNAAPVTTSGEVAAPGAPANGYSGSLTSAKRLPYTESANGTDGQTEGTDREKLAEDLRRLDEPHDTPAARDGTGTDRPFTIQGDGIRLPKGLPQARL